MDAEGLSMVNLHPGALEDGDSVRQHIVFTAARRMSAFMTRGIWNSASGLAVKKYAKGA